MKKQITYLLTILTLGLSLTATARNAPKSRPCSTLRKDMDKSVAFSEKVMLF